MGDLSVRDGAPRVRLLELEGAPKRTLFTAAREASQGHPSISAVREALAERGATAVLVTHDQGEALTMSDRVAVFHQGEIQQIADPRTLYEEPCNTFVANFIGENNRINGRLLSQTGDRCLVALPRGEKVEALAVNVGNVGDTVSLSIRPERLQLVAEDTSSAAPCTVVQQIYLGTDLQYQVELQDGSKLTVRAPNSAGQRQWKTPSGRANFKANALPDDLLDDAAPAEPDAVATGADDSTGEAAP